MVFFFAAAELCHFGVESETLFTGQVFVSLKG